MVYDEIKTVQAIRWINSYFWKRTGEPEGEFSVPRLARLFEVSEKFVEDIIKKKIYPDVRPECIFPCMEKSLHRQACLRPVAELPEELLKEPSPAVLDLMEIEESLK